MVRTPETMQQHTKSMLNVGGRGAWLLMGTIVQWRALA